MVSVLWVKVTYSTGRGLALRLCFNERLSLAVEQLSGPAAESPHSHWEAVGQLAAWSVSQSTLKNHWSGTWEGHTVMFYHLNDQTIEDDQA